MTYPGSRSHSWVAGERVDHDVLNAWGPPNVAWGNPVASASATSSQTGITTVTDLTSLSVTFTAAADRRYLILGTVPVLNATAASRLELVLADGSNTVLQVVAHQYPGTDYHQMSMQHDVVPGSGSVTYKLRLQRGAGTGSGGSVPLGGWSARLFVLDAGPTTP